MIERSSRCGKLGKRLKLTMIHIKFVVSGEVLFLFFFEIFRGILRKFLALCRSNSWNIFGIFRRFVDLLASNLEEIF